jgi:ABC-type dipeptide/oligopeptide/nickel transport system permease subunit
VSLPREAARRFAADRGAVLGAAIVVLLVALAAARPWIAPRDPIAVDVDRGLSPLGAPLPPSAHAPLGTDPLGRDVWARLVAADTTSLVLAGLATALALGLGVAIGLAAGFAGGRVDGALMRAVDLVLAFPFLLLAILVAVLLRARGGAGSAAVVLTLGLTGWTTAARVVRGKVRALARAEFVVAARALGASPARIAVRHVLPGLGGVVGALAGLGFAQNLLAASALAYVGLGPPAPIPTWGGMLWEGHAYYRTAPWLVIAPGVAILVAVVGFTLLGDGVRGALDERTA